MKSNVLLFLQEYDRFIVLLEIANHGANFHNVPVGDLLQKNHLAPLQVQLPSYVQQAEADARRAARQNVASMGTKTTSSITGIGSRVGSVFST